MRRPTRLPIAMSVALALLLAPAASAGGKITRAIPEITEAGHFEGTWYYIAAHLEMAIWIREAEDGYDVRLEWRARSGLRFKTDWGGDGVYSMRGFPGTVTLEVDPEETDENAIVGTYQRVLELEEGDYRREGGPFRIERTGDGNGLMWSFHPYTEEKRVADNVLSGTRDDIFFELIKASFRIVEYEDIPW